MRTPSITSSTAGFKATDHGTAAPAGFFWTKTVPFESKEVAHVLGVGFPDGGGVDDIDRLGDIFFQRGKRLSGDHDLRQFGGEAVRFRFGK